MEKIICSMLFIFCIACNIPQNKIKYDCFIHKNFSGHDSLPFDLTRVFSEELIDIIDAEVISKRTDLKVIDGQAMDYLITKTDITLHDFLYNRDGADFIPVHSDTSKIKLYAVGKIFMEETDSGWIIMKEIVEENTKQYQIYICIVYKNRLTAIGLASATSSLSQNRSYCKTIRLKGNRDYFCPEQNKVIKSPYAYILYLDESQKYGMGVFGSKQERADKIAQIKKSVKHHYCILGCYENHFFIYSKVKI